MRGGTALTGSADVIVEVERPSQSAGLSSAARVVKIVSRFAGAPDEIAVELDERRLALARHGEGGGAPLEARGDPGAARRRAAHARGDPRRARAACRRTTVRRRLDELVENGLAERVGEGKRADPHRWQLSETAELS